MPKENDDYRKLKLIKNLLMKMEKEMDSNSVLLDLMKHSKDMDFTFSAKAEGKWFTLGSVYTDAPPMMGLGYSEPSTSTSWYIMVILPITITNNLHQL